MAFVGLFMVVGALIGSLVLKVAGVPLTLSTAGGALVVGISADGCVGSPNLRTDPDTDRLVHELGRPQHFIAIVGISAGPGFVNGLKTQGAGLFLWGALASTLPLVLGMLIAKYLFRFHDALTLGIVSGSRTTTASLGLVCDQAKSQVPSARLHGDLRRRRHGRRLGFGCRGGSRRQVWRVGDGMPQRGVPGLVLGLAAYLTARLRGDRSGRRKLNLERNVARLHEAEALSRLRRDVGRVGQLALALLQILDLGTQRGFGRRQLRHLGALAKIRAHRTGDGQRQNAHHRGKDRGPPRGEAEPLIRPLINGFGERPLDGFDNMLLQRAVRAATFIRSGLRGLGQRLGEGLGDGLRRARGTTAPSGITGFPRA